MDEMYEERDESGYPMSWGALVEVLRDLGLAVERGVNLGIEDGKDEGFGRFYSRAQKRYHAPEDGCDSRIGDDNSRLICQEIKKSPSLPGP